MDLTRNAFARPIVLTAQLEPAEREVLHRALRSALPGADPLELFVSLKLGPSLATITPPGGIDIMILRVIQWAEANGKTQDLLRGALDSFASDRDVMLGLPPLLNKVQRQNQQEQNRAGIQQLQSIPDLPALIANVGELVHTLQQMLPTLDPVRGRGAVEAGKRAIEKPETLGETAHLTDTEQGGLEAIVLATGRPALLIKDGTFSKPPARWVKLETKRREIEPAIEATGRVEIEGHTALKWLGTAFLVAPNVVAVPDFVVHQFGELKRGRWVMRKDRTVRIDFRREYNLDAANVVVVVSILGVSKPHGIAILEVSYSSADGTMPVPLQLATNPDLTAERDVYLIGYAGMDTRRPPDFLRDVFQNIFDVKRLCPGQILKVDVDEGSGKLNRIEHDCSSSGGMSGAPLIDLDTGQAIGMHYGARHLVAGYATPLHTLQDTRLAKNVGLVFE